MDTSRRNALSRLQRAIFFAGIAGVAFAEPAGAFLFARPVQKPAAQEFGFGPRESARQLYVAYLRPAELLGPRKLQDVRVLVLDAAGRPVEDARIAAEAGMPEHSHELPTRPHAQRALGGGMYDIEGLHFGKGGWWELRFDIEGPAGADRVTFNLAL